MMEMLSYQLQLRLHKLVLPCLIHPARMLQLPLMHQLAFLPQPASFEHTPWSEITHIIVSVIYPYPYNAYRRILHRILLTRFTFSAKSFWIGSVAAAAGLSSAYEAPKFLLMLTRANVAAERNNGVADNILSNFIDCSVSKILLMQLLASQLSS